MIKAANLIGFFGADHVQRLTRLSAFLLRAVRVLEPKRIPDALTAFEAAAAAID